MSAKNVFSALAELDVSDNESITSETESTSVSKTGGDKVRSKEDPWNLKNKPNAVNNMPLAVERSSEDDTSKTVPRRTFQVADSSDSKPSDSEWVAVKAKNKKPANKNQRNNKRHGSGSRYHNKGGAGTDPGASSQAETNSETETSVVDESTHQTRKMDIPLDEPEKVAKPKVSYASMIKESKHVSSEPSVPKPEAKKKSFTAPIVKRDGAIELPAYYKVRGDDMFEIPQNEYAFIKRVGGLEKSDGPKSMLLGVLNCGISYFNNQEFLLNNKFFKDRITTDPVKQEDLMEQILMHAAAILFHRLTKSDDTASIQMILNNLPLYRIVTSNNYDHGSNSKTPTFGGPTFARIKNRWFANLRIIGGRDSRYNDPESIARATAANAETKRKLEHYILQSVWNCNNPIHDCLYYGASGSFRLLLNYYMSNGMKAQLNNMMLVPNIQGETHKDIVFNGKLACEKQSSYIIRRKQFGDCEDLYNRTIIKLREEMHDIAEAEAKEIVSSASATVSATVSATNETAPSEVAVSETLDRSDDVNFTDIFYRQDTVAMINHLLKCHTSGNSELIRATVAVWRDILDSEPNDEMEDCLNDVLECAEMRDINIEQILSGSDSLAEALSASGVSTNTATDC